MVLFNMVSRVGSGHLLPLPVSDNRAVDHDSQRTRVTYVRQNFGFKFRVSLLSMQGTVLFEVLL